jgi:hypothetical protein
MKNSILGNGHHTMIGSHLDNFSHFMINEWNNPQLINIEDVSEFDGDIINNRKLVEE